MHYEGMIHEEKTRFISYLISSILYHMGGYDLVAMLVGIHK